VVAGVALRRMEDRMTPLGPRPIRAYVPIQGSVTSIPPFAEQNGVQRDQTQDECCNEP
jgi:hypothetical protein